MEQIRLGRSNLTVSRIAFGTWQLGDDWGATDEGINFFDGVPVGGPTPESV
jgi:aryl-alcohol dehydrogenase-like predicted oxidoreductase